MNLESQPEAEAGHLTELEAAHMSIRLYWLGNSKAARLAPYTLPNLAVIR